LPLFGCVVAVMVICCEIAFKSIFLCYFNHSPRHYRLR